MTEIRLITLGAVQVWVDGVDETLALPTKVVAMLVYLARHQTPKPRQHLAELLWSHRSTKNAYGSLRMALNKSRRLLGDALTVNSQSVSLTAWCDANEFEKFAQTPQTYAQSVALYQGEFMPSFFVNDVNDFEVWQRQQSQHLQDTFLMIASAHIRTLTHQNKLQTAIRQAQQALRIVPYHEDLHRLLIDLYHRTDNRAGALRQYEICQQMLWEEFGIEPGKATQVIIERLDTTNSLSDPPLQLNVLTTTFVGRADAMVQLTQRINQHQLVTAIATGGIGKTRLAIEVASRLQPKFKDGVVFVDLSKIAHVDEFPLLLAKTLSLGVSPDIQQSIINHLQARDMLLILDNFEHVMDAAKIVADLRQNAPPVKFLVTSRQSLKLYEGCA